MLKKQYLVFILQTIFCLLLISNESLFAQWERKTNGLPEWLVTDPLDVANDSTIAAFFITAQFPRPISISHDLANTWMNYITPDQWDGTDVSVIDRSRIWFCTGEGSIYHTSDSGNSWVLQFQDTLSYTFFNFIKFFNREIGIAIGDPPSDTSPATVVKTTDGGNYWQSINDNSLIGEYSRDVFFCIEFPSLTAGYFSGGKPGRSSHILYKTTDGGYSWIALNNPNGINKIYMIKFYNENLGMLVSDIHPGNDFIYRTTDGGENWTQLPLQTNTNHHDIEFIPGSPSNVWFTDYNNLYFSSDTGSTWQEVSVTDQSLAARNIEFLNDSTGFISCDDGYFWATFNKGGVVTSLDRQNEFIPESFTLKQNYPNPFSARGGSGSDGNPATTIEYTIPGRSTKYYSVQQNVVLKVYDILGTELATLVKRQQAPGNNRVEFNGSDLSSGLYMYRLISGDLTSARKMLLIK